MGGEVAVSTKPWQCGQVRLGYFTSWFKEHSWRQHIAMNPHSFWGYWPCLNIKIVYPGMGIPIIKIRRSYLYDKNAYTGTTEFLYWDSFLVLKWIGQLLFKFIHSLRLGNSIIMHHNSGSLMNQEIVLCLNVCCRLEPQLKFKPLY